jgi:uncharacterized protein (DUF1800 family)
MIPIRVAALASLLLLPTLSANAALKADPATVERLLSRVTFGPTSGDRAYVSRVGIERYLNEQLEPSAIDDSAIGQRLATLSTLRTTTPALLARFNPPKPANPAMPLPADLQLCTSLPVLSPVTPKPAPQPQTPQQVVSELQRASFVRAVYSRKQLYERMVSFWENHFSVYVNKDADRLYLTSFDRDTIRPFALGSFRALLGATAHSPAMLYYLDNWQSTIPHAPPSTGRPVRLRGGLNENYARELLELHTMGVDGGYTQNDVEEVARCFTGWTIYKANEDGLFLFNPAEHDDGEKVVLGHRIPPGGGIADGEMVLDILARHPSTARFIARKLARMFVSDDPPEALVRRAAAVFLKTDGSIAETVRCIVTSKELFDRHPYSAKLKSPFEYAVSAVRALGAETDGGPEMLGWIARMGQPLFGRLTPDGYPDRAQTWLSTGLLLERLNFAVAIANNQIKGTHLDPSRAAAEVAKLTLPAGSVAKSAMQPPVSDLALRIGSPQFQNR